MAYSLPIKHCAIGTLVGLLVHSGANAQKGSRKSHGNMAKIAPDRTIPATPVLDVIDAGCHGKIGESLPKLGSTLTGSDWVTGDKELPYQNSPPRSYRSYQDQR